MDKEELIREAMRELGRKSAAARKAKGGKDWMKTVQEKGAEARRKTEHKSEPIKKQPQKDKNMPFSID